MSLSAVTPEYLKAAKDLAGGASLKDKMGMGYDLTALMMASMQLKQEKAKLEGLQLISQMQQKMGGNPQAPTTVAQDVDIQKQQIQAQLGGQPQQPMQGIPQVMPQGMPQGMPQAALPQGQQPDEISAMMAIGGLASLPAANFNDDSFAGGGIIAFAEGDEVPKANGNNEMLNRLIQAESGRIHIDPKTGELLRSPKGAEGITQLMPGTQKSPGFGVAPAKDRSQEEFTRVGKDYLDAMINRYGDPEKGAAAYNYGPGNLDKVLRKHPDNWINFVPAETRKYVAKVASPSKIASADYVMPQREGINSRILSAITGSSPAYGANDSQSNDSDITLGDIGAAAGTAGIGGAAILDRVNAPRIAAAELYNRHPIYGQAGAAPKAPITLSGAAGRAGKGISSLLNSKVVPALPKTGLGAVGALAAPIAAAYETGSTPTEAYDKRFGFEPTEGSGLGSLATDIGKRGLGFASDLADTMTFGLAGKLAGYRDKQEPSTKQDYTRKTKEPSVSDVPTREQMERNQGPYDVPYGDSGKITKVSGEDASTQAAPYAGDKFIDDEVKRIIDARKAQVPLTREAGMKQWKEERDAFGLKDEFGKEQVDRLAGLARQAKQDRDVNLWLSAATGFFAMGAGKSPYALQNFAAGAGIGAEQATKALGAYSKRQSEMNQAQLDIDKARRAEKRGDFESYQNHMQRAEEKAQKSDDNYFNRMTSLVGISQRGQEIKESRLNRQDLQRRELARKQLDDFRDTLGRDPEYASAKKGFEGLDQMSLMYKNNPAALAAETKKYQDRMTAAETRVKRGYPALGGGGFTASDIDAEIARRQSKG